MVLCVVVTLGRGQTVVCSLWQPTYVIVFASTSRSATKPNGTNIEFKAAHIMWAGFHPDTSLHGLSLGLPQLNPDLGRAQVLQVSLSTSAKQKHAMPRKTADQNTCQLHWDPTRSSRKHIAKTKGTKAQLRVAHITWAGLHPDTSLHGLRLGLPQLSPDFGRTQVLQVPLSIRAKQKYEMPRKTADQKNSPAALGSDKAVSQAQAA